MKTLLFIVGFVLCNSFVSVQNFRHFEERKGSMIELTPKNLSDFYSTKPYDNRSWVKSEEDLNELLAPLVKDAFKGLNEADIESLRRLRFSIVIDHSRKVVYFRFHFLEKYRTEMMRLEEQMHKLSQKFLGRDMKAYFEVYNEELFQRTEWNIGSLYRLYKNPVNPLKY